MVPRVPTRTVRQVTTLPSCLCAIVSIGSCDKVPLLAPTESVITLVSNRAVLPINGTAQIVAIVIEQSGTPAHNGTLVTFTTTLGTLDPRESGHQQRPGGRDAQGRHGIRYRRGRGV